MRDAVDEYRGHLEAPDRWALGRFVVPISRWEEFQAAVADSGATTLWSVSLLASPADADRIVAAKTDSRFVVNAVECKAASVAEAAQAERIVTEGVDVFVEPVKLDAFDAMAPVLARIGASAKIRTGGVTSDAFPAPREVLEFLTSCKRAGIRFKATAGLHHAVRGEYRLTYEPGSPTSVMYGFLNVAVGAALLWHGRNDNVVLEALQTRSLDAFEFTDEGLAWHNERLSRDEVQEVRSRFFVGFGSCSFGEPVAEIGLQGQPRA
jgi:hypothetical protein